MSNKNKVLIVEDNELNMKLFVDILTHYNFDIKAVRDGSKAINTIKEYMPQLILMDIQLGGISGLDLAKKIKKTSEIMHIPIIAITAFAMKHDKKKIIDSGCRSYLTKPISIMSLIQEVKKHILNTECTN